MRMILDNRRIEEIDVYMKPDGTKKYITSADYGMELDPIAHTEVRNDIIRTFEALY